MTSSARSNRVPVITLLAIALVVTGSFLEVYYYMYRFAQDGIPIWLGAMIGLGLNGLLIFAITIRKPWALLLIVFSVLSTSAGQTFSLIQTDARETREAFESKTAYEISSLSVELDRLAVEDRTLQDQINSTVKTLEDRFTWKNTLDKTEKRRDAIAERTKEIRLQIESLKNSSSVKTLDRLDIYSFYSSLTNGTVSADILKFVLHTALSVFIAIMAPSGVALLQGGIHENRSKKAERLNRISKRSNSPTAAKTNPTSIVDSDKERAPERDPAQEKAKRVRRRRSQVPELEQTKRKRRTDRAHDTMGRSNKIEQSTEPKPKNGWVIGSRARYEK